MMWKYIALADDAPLIFEMADERAAEKSRVA